MCSPGRKRSLCRAVPPSFFSCLSLSLARTALGSIVQKGKFSAGMPILVSTLNRVDLPTLGRPTMPIWNDGTGKKREVGRVEGRAGGRADRERKTEQLSQRRLPREQADGPIEQCVSVSQGLPRPSPKRARGWAEKGLGCRAPTPSPLRRRPGRAGAPLSLSHLSSSPLSPSLGRTFKLDLKRPMMGFSAGASGFFLGAMVGEVCEEGKREIVFSLRGARRRSAFFLHSW